MTPAHASSWKRSRARLSLRLAAGALVVFVGSDHYYEDSVEHYSQLPTVGTLFLLNFIGATACGLLRPAPLEQLATRLGRVTWWLAACGGFAIGFTSLIGLLVSEQTPLFGYMELNYRAAVLVGLGTEAASAALCAALLVLEVRDARSGERLVGPTRDEPRRDPDTATAVSPT